MTTCLPVLNWQDEGPGLYACIQRNKFLFHWFEMSQSESCQDNQQALESLLIWVYTNHTPSSYVKMFTNVNTFWGCQQEVYSLYKLKYHTGNFPITSPQQWPESCSELTPFSFLTFSVSHPFSHQTLHNTKALKFQKCRECTMCEQPATNIC